MTNMTIPAVTLFISFPELDEVDFKPLDRSDRPIKGRVSIQINGEEKMTFSIPAEIKDGAICVAGFSIPEEAEEMFQTLLSEE